MSVRPNTRVDAVLAALAGVTGIVAVAATVLTGASLTASRPIGSGAGEAVGSTDVDFFRELRLPAGGAAEEVEHYATVDAAASSASAVVVGTVTGVTAGSIGWSCPRVSTCRARTT